MTQADQIQAARTQLDRAIDRHAALSLILGFDVGRWVIPAGAAATQRRQLMQRVDRAERGLGRAIANYTRTVRKLKK